MFSILAVAALIHRGPVVVVSWDGAPSFVIQRMLREGKLPNVARLAKSGFIAEGSVSSWPSKTAVSHMVAFSGKSPGENGVSGNSVPLMPRSEHTILESMSGFNANAHTADPLWVWAAKNGKKTLALSAAGSYPPAPDQARLKEAGVPLDRYVEFSGFESTLQAGMMIHGKGSGPLKLKVADTEFEVAPEKLANGAYGGLRVVSGDRVAHLHVGKGKSGWSHTFAVRKGDLLGSTRFRLFKIDPQSGDYDLFRWKASAIKGTESAESNARYLEAYGCFHDDMFFEYTKGGVGQPLFKGGNGEAERVMLDLIDRDCEDLKASFRYGLKTYKPDLIFHYSPQVDSCGHSIMGLLDPTSSAYRPDIAPQMARFYESVIQKLDGWLGDMMDAAGPGADFVLFSDHGMAGVNRFVYVNRILADAGLVAFKDKKIDLGATKVCASPNGDFYLTVNTTDWKDGVVPPAEKDQVLAQAAKALLDFRDPNTGQPLITKVHFGQELAQMGVQGPTCGDMYLEFAPDVYPNSGFAESAVRAGDPALGSGVHGFNPNLDSMLAMLVAGGPNVKRHGKVGTMSHTMLAPLVQALLQGK